jgi:hypothetical protein
MGLGCQRLAAFQTVSRRLRATLGTRAPWCPRSPRVFDLSWPLFDLLGEAGDWHPKYKY